MKKLFLLLFLFLANVSILINAQNIINGDFEQGPNSGWGLYSSNGAGLIGTAEFFSSASIDPTVYPRSGQYMARLGGFAYAENSISQTVTLPSTQNVYLHIFYQDRCFTGAECSGLYAGAKIRVIIAGQTLSETYLCYYNEVHDWTHVYFDLSTAAGLTIDIIFRADAANSMWSFIYFDDFSISSSITDVEDEEVLPSDFVLSQNYPNPFNPSTSINYNIPIRSKIKLDVFTVTGELAATLVDQVQDKGSYTVKFNASEKPSGIYFCRLMALDENGNRTVRQSKMLLLK